MIPPAHTFTLADYIEWKSWNESVEGGEKRGE